MAARDVPAALLWQALDEAEAECTLERFHEWYRREVAGELRKIPRPKVDQWNHWGNRDAAITYRMACEGLIRSLWKKFRRLVRARTEEMIHSHIVRYGDHMFRQLGGSLTEYLDTMMAEIETGSCACERERRVQSLRERREAKIAVPTA